MKANIQFVNIILAVLIVCRHYFFYGGFGIDTEFGPNQPFFSYLLIPVTGMIGASFLWRSVHSINVRKLTMVKIFILILASVFLNVYVFKIDESLFTYSVYDDSRRPVFLILVPILLSVLLCTTFKKKTHIIIFTVCLFILYGYTNNFVVHYLCIFCIIYLFSPYLNSKRISIYYYLIVYVSCSLTFFINYERLNIIVEIVWVISSLGIIYGASEFVRLNLFRFSILEFYVLQAVFFYVMKYMDVGVEYWVPLVLLSSLSCAWVLKGFQND